MKPSVRLCSLLSVLLTLGCSSYITLQTRKSINPPDGLVLSGNPDNDNYSTSYITAGLDHYDSVRYIFTKGSSDAATVILHAGASEAENGNLHSAEILFLELAGSEKNGSVENNLAVIYELYGDYDSAFSMYIRAINLDPENTLYRKNLYYFMVSGALFRNRPSEKNGN